MKKIVNSFLDLPAAAFAPLAMLLVVFVFGIACYTRAADFTVPTQATRGIAPTALDVSVTNRLNTAGLTISKPATNTADLLQVKRGGTNVFGVPATNPAAGMRQYLGIKSGTVVTATDGTVTNVFSPVFTNTPVIITRQLGIDTTVTNILTVTSNYFILNTRKANQTNNWIAVGAQ